MSQLAVPDMSRLAALMPGRESTTAIPAGQRLQVAIADSSRVSLIISSDSSDSLTLSTVTTGTSSQGLQFPSGLSQPLMVTWDIYGGKLHDAWFAQNNGTGEINITTIEVVSRPDANPLDKLAGCDLQPLKKCLPKKKLPVYLPPPIFVTDDEVTPGLTCETAPSVILGNSYPVHLSGADEAWWRFVAVAGNYRLRVVTSVNQNSLLLWRVYQGSCLIKVQKALYSGFQPGTQCGNGDPGNSVILTDGDVWVNVLNAAAIAEVVASFVFELGTC